MKGRAQSYIEAIFSSVIWTLLDRATALLKHVIIASTLGLGIELDVFYMTVSLIGLFVFSWSKIADVMAVPELVKLHMAGKSQEARAFTGDLFTLSVIFSGVLGTIVTWTWPILIKLAWGFDAERMAYLETTIHWAGPLVFLYIPIKMLYSFAKAQRRFSIAYRNEFLIAITILACMVTYPTTKGVMIWSYSLGVSLAFCLTVVSLRGSIQWLGSPFSASIKRLLPMIPSLLFIYGAQYVYALIDRQFVSFLPQGAVSAVAYGWTLINIVPELLRLDGPFITVYAEASRESAEKILKLNQLISASISAGVLMTFLIFGFSEEAVGLFLERGNFSRDNTLMVASCTANFAFAIIPILLIGPIGQIFQVENRLKLVAKRILFGLFLNAIFGFIFMFIFEWGPKGVALATSLSQWGMLITSLSSMARLGLQVDFKRHFQWLLLMTTAALMALIALYPLRQLNLAYWMIIPNGAAFLAVAAWPILLLRRQDSRLARELVKRALARFQPTAKRSAAKSQ